MYEDKKGIEVSVYTYIRTCVKSDREEATVPSRSVSSLVTCTVGYYAGPPGQKGAIGNPGGPGSPGQCANCSHA